MNTTARRTAPRPGPVDRKKNNMRGVVMHAPYDIRVEDPVANVILTAAAAVSQPATAAR
jgi:hypothetical protein